MVPDKQKKPGSLDYVPNYPPLPYLKKGPLKWHWCSHRKGLWESPCNWLGVNLCCLIPKYLFWCLVRKSLETLTRDNELKFQAHFYPTCKNEVIRGRDLRGGRLASPSFLPVHVRPPFVILFPFRNVLLKIMYCCFVYMHFRFTHLVIRSIFHVPWCISTDTIFLRSVHVVLGIDLTLASSCW